MLAGGGGFPPRIGSENPEPRRLRLGGLSDESFADHACESGGHLLALDRVRRGLRAGDPASRAAWRIGIAGIPSGGIHLGSHGELRAWHSDVLRLFWGHIS